MKNAIYWFSGTGNSLAVATDLAQASGDTELIPIARAIRGSLRPCEVMGVVFPVYAFGLPRIVREFLAQAPAAKARYIFTVATMGGIAGAVHKEAAQILAERGLTLAAGWSVVMPGNYPVLRNPPPPAKQERIFAGAKEKTARIAAAVARRETGAGENTRPPLRWPLEFLHNLARGRYCDEDGHFAAGGACTHCGICARVCPVENIRMVEKKPVWMHHCEQCMACLQWCPAQAIELGKATVGKKRYHHPRFKAADLFLRKE